MICLRWEALPPLRRYFRAISTTERFGARRIVSVMIFLLFAAIWVPVIGNAADPQMLATYSGAYACSQGPTRLTLYVYATSPITVLFEFGPLGRGSGVPSGAFMMAGRLDPRGSILDLSPIRWISQPAGYFMVGLEGLSQDQGRSFFGYVSGGVGCSTFRIVRDNASSLTPPSPPLNSGLGPTTQQNWADQQIDPLSISTADIQLIQDALIWQGLYTGLKDGQWGPMTQSAFDAFCNKLGRPTPCPLTPNNYISLMGASWKRKEEMGWKIWTDPQTQSSIGYPSKLLTPHPLPRHQYSVGTEYVGDKGLTFTTGWIAGDVEQLKSIFQPLEHVSSSKVLYRLDKSERQVWLIKIAETEIYIRYDKVNVGWRGIVVHFPTGENYSYLVAAITADFGADGAPVVRTSQPFPLFYQIMRWVQEKAKPAGSVDSQPTTSRPRPNEPSNQSASRTPLRPTEAGTGFFVGPSGQMVTAAHVVSGCSAIKLADETSLKIVGSDTVKDLALLSAPLKTPNYLHLSKSQDIELGEKAYVFGFPYFGSVSTSINLTDGIVTSLLGIGNNPLYFQMNANVQPGNSGGPVVDDTGAVIGVAVARLSDLAILRATGTIPQSMNYAIRTAALSSFLLEHSLLPDTSEQEKRLDPSDIARLVTPAVRPIICYK